MTPEAQRLLDALSVLSALKPQVDPMDHSPSREPFNRAWTVALANAARAADAYVTSEKP